ncbi:uncharacterized protein [Manis javanica]|uniref:uncharacterized protein n=1 Tax=Manis javanica TaxID=9974 RepID=UPI003C6CE2F7
MSSPSCIRPPLGVQRPAQSRVRQKAFPPNERGTTGSGPPPTYGTRGQRGSGSAEQVRERCQEELLPRLIPCSSPLSLSGRLRPSVPSAQRARRRLDCGPALCSAAPSSRRGGAGGTDLARWDPGAALAASRLSRGGRRAAIDPDLEPSTRPDLRPSSPAASSLAPSCGRDQELRCGRGPGLGLSGRRGTTAQEQLIGRSTWGRLSPADGFARASEIPAGKRLPPPRTCGGASRAGPASGVKATATALWAGRKRTKSIFLTNTYTLGAWGPSDEAPCAAVTAI